MRKILAVFLFFALPLAAQVNNPSVRYVVTSPSGSCSEAPPIQVNSTNGNVCTCGGGTWTCSGGVVYPGVTSPGTGGLQGTDWELGTTGTLTTPQIDFPQGSGTSPWTVQVNQGLSDTNEIVFSAAQNHKSYDDLAFIVHNTALYYSNNCGTYSATEGVVTFTCASGQNPSSAANPPCVQFAGYTGSLAALNSPAGDTAPSCSGVAFQSTYVGATQFSIATALVTGSGTDNTGSANFWPIATALGAVDAAGGGDLAFGGQFGLLYENAPKVTAPGQKFVAFSDSNVPARLMFECDLYSDACKFFGTVNSVGGYSVGATEVAGIPQTAAISVGPGADPADGGTADCYVATGYPPCTSKSGTVEVTFGTTPANGDLFTVSWTGAKPSNPTAFFTMHINGVVTFPGISTCLFLDETGLSTTAMPVYYSSDCQGNFFSPIVGQIELVSYHIDPDLP